MGKRKVANSQSEQSHKKKRNKTESKSKVIVEKNMPNLDSCKNCIEIDNTNSGIRNSSNICEKEKVKDNISASRKKNNDPLNSEQATVLSSSNSRQTKSKQFLNTEDAEVSDEEIDKFCDEINEEDNEQFELWVKQIELKLHSNNKK